MKHKLESRLPGETSITILRFIFSFSITSWQIDMETMETVRDFIFLGSKITADGDYRLDSVLKSKDITLQTKIYTVKAMVFPVVMFGCENWTIKKAQY